MALFGERRVPTEPTQSHLTSSIGVENPRHDRPAAASSGGSARSSGVLMSGAASARSVVSRVMVLNGDADRRTLLP